LKSSDTLSIGELAARAGVAPSALRFYESRGLLGSARSGGGHRTYPRSALRRVAFIRAAQAVGLSLQEVQAALASLPDGRTPTAADWQRLSAQWRGLLDQRMAALHKLRDDLTSCIGCGCLSLQRCRLYNPQDAAGSRGAVPRDLMGGCVSDVLAAAAAYPTEHAPGHPRRR
jgi:MerR family transcriptional regulator, redox-sensitive transcriptional activator SoxR